jgi:hypothetical protein
MSTRFDLEQQIMQCWGVTDDIDVIYHSEHLYDDEDAMQNALLGAHSLADLRFQKLWALFEKGIAEGWIK